MTITNNNGVHILVHVWKHACSVCGQAPLNNRIVGGEAAAKGAWPWMVSLHRLNRHFCGGSLINSEWVLSAAHCFSRSSRSVTAFLGRQSQQGSNSNEEPRSVVQIISHPAYNSRTNDNDVALLRLSLPVTFNNFIRPVCLAAASSSFFAGTDSWVTGWGNVGSNDPLPFPQNLMEVQVPVVGNRQCGCDYIVPGRITDNMICAGLREGGKDSCQGDSGGPMVSKQGSVWVLSGVVSFGVGCALPQFPGVYARVSQYQEWISRNVGNDNLPGFVTFRSAGPNSDLGVSCLAVPPLIGGTPPTTTRPTTTTPTTTTPTTTIEPTTTTPPREEGEPEPWALCGRAPLNPRLSGNNSASAVPGLWPWMASLHRNGSHVCGGTLVAEDAVLSGAQCFAQSSTPSEWTVFLGRSRQNSANIFETAVSVINITTSTLSGQNVAVLRLASRASLSNFIQPICMDSGQNFATGSTCWAAGWSAGQGGEDQALQEVQMSLMDCGNESSADSICMEPLALDQGDLGGPLMCQLGESWYQAAVLWANSTGNASQELRQNQSTVLSRLRTFNDFLMQEVGEFLSPSNPPTTTDAPTATDAPTSNVIAEAADVGDSAGSPAPSLLSFLSQFSVLAVVLHAAVMML
ncbi:polyserase-2-like [Festucalex cinctus]